MEQPTTSFKTVGTGSRASRSLWLCSGLSVRDILRGEGKPGLESLCVVEGRGEGKGKINLFDVK